MQFSKLNSNSSLSVYILCFDKGEMFVEGMVGFAKREGLSGGSFIGLGAFSRGELAFFNRDTNEYDPIPVDEQVEVLNVNGNIALFEGEPRIHAHAILSRPDGTTIGGHLVEGVVWPTLELTVFETDGTIEREIDEETGLALIRIKN
jgi:hypothetical protein